MNHFKKELDFTPASNVLEDVLFDVQKVNLITSLQNSDLFTGPNLDKIPATGYKALVNTKEREVLCVVSDRYNLISNKDALNLGKEAFVQLFPSVKKDDLIVFKVIAPLRKTFCHIDLIHKDVNLKKLEQDTWFPFIRITNSYNRMFALSIELGFVRKLCSNGVIFDKKTIKIKYVHTQVDLPAIIDVDIQQLKILENEFIKHLLNLKRFYVPKSHFFPMFCKALELRFNFDNPLNPLEKQQYNNFIDLREVSNQLAFEYSEQVGENAYAAFNVMTDIVSHQEHYRNIPNYTLRSNRYYQKVSNWMREYTEHAEKRDFHLDKYLGDYLKYNLLN